MLKRFSDRAVEIIDLWKEIVEMDKYDLTEVWNGLDTVCEDVEKLLNKLSSMSGLPDELQQEINNLDISSISNLKHHIGKILDDIEIKERAEDDC